MPTKRDDLTTGNPQKQARLDTEGMEGDDLDFNAYDTTVEDAQDDRADEEAEEDENEDEVSAEDEGDKKEDAEDVANWRFI